MAMHRWDRRARAIEKILKEYRETDRDFYEVGRRLELDDEMRDRLYDIMQGYDSRFTY